MKKPKTMTQENWDCFRKEMSDFHNFVVSGGFVPSGGYCKSCERDNCGCDEAARVDRDRDRGILT